MAMAVRGSRRKNLLRLSPLLKDASLTLRTAAAAGLVRGVGTSKAFQQMHLLFKETNPKPYLAVAAELAKRENRASAQFWGA